MFSSVNDSIFGFLKFILHLLRYPLIAVALLLGIMVVLLAVNFAWLRTKGYRRKKGNRKYIKQPSLLKKLFVLFPKQLAFDYITKDPDYFNPSGMVIFCGRQGSGKTSSMVWEMLKLQEEYPLAKVITNLGYPKEDECLDHWKKLIHYKNDIHGVVAVLDELQNWFSSNQSRNFPPEMLGVITQNRKNRRIIMGTAQNFYMLAKSIRTQCTEVRDCTTLFGCFTIVVRKIPIMDADGNVKEWKKRGMYSFVHSKKLRTAFDTYKVIEALSQSGFKEEAVLKAI